MNGWKKKKTNEHGLFTYLYVDQKRYFMISFTIQVFHCLHSPYYYHHIIMDSILLYTMKTSEKNHTELCITERKKERECVCGGRREKVREKSL